MVFHGVSAMQNVDNKGALMQIVASSHIRHTLPDRLAGFHHALLVADPDTYQAVGSEVLQHVCKDAHATLLLLPKHPSPTLALAQELTTALHAHPCAVAVGSGTINDLVKYAAHSAHKPYAVLATAPSMNGYTSSTASLLVDGHKQSFAATAAALVLADTEVLRHAPARMVRAGVGDVLCRTTVEADWRLAHVKAKATFEEAIMQPMRAAEAALIAHIDGIAARTAEAIMALWGALTAGGSAMRLHGSSMPASQGEHMIAHCMEEAMPEATPLHGEAIAVTSLSMAKLQESLLAHPSLSEAALWIGEHQLNAQALEVALKQAGCPTTPQELGWDEQTYRTVCNKAWKSRDRYGFLTLAAELNINAI